MLEDRVSFRTTLVVVGLFSISDSEFALSLVDSDDLLLADVDELFGIDVVVVVVAADVVVDADPFLLVVDFLFGGKESALDSVSDSLWGK